MFLQFSINSQVDCINFEKKNTTFVFPEKKSLDFYNEDILKLFFPKDSTISTDATGETYIKHKGTNIERFVGSYSTTEPWNTRILLIVPDNKTENQFFVLTETFNPKVNSHVNSAVLGFGIIQFSQNKLQIALAHHYSSLIGTFGRFLKRENLSLLALSPQRFGVLIQGNDIHQGVTSHSLSLYEITEQKLKKVFSGFLEPESNAEVFNPNFLEEPIYSIQRSLYLTSDLKQVSEGYYDLTIYINGLQYKHHNFLVKNLENTVIRLKRKGNHYIPDQNIHKDFHNTTRESFLPH